MKVRSWVVASSTAITKGLTRSLLITHLWPPVFPNTRRSSQGISISTGTQPWVGTSLSIRYWPQHRTWQLLLLRNAILPLYGLSGLWRVVCNHRNDVVKQHGSWCVMKCYRHATPELRPSGGVVTDALVTGLSRDVLYRKSSAGSRMGLAWEGRYQPLTQLKVLKLKPRNPLQLHHFFTQLLKEADDAELCFCIPTQLWGCVHWNLLPTRIGTLKPGQDFLEEILAPLGLFQRPVHGWKTPF